MTNLSFTITTPRRHTLHCASTGCKSAITPDERHIANLTARGAWSCATHAAH